MRALVTFFDTRRPTLRTAAARLLHAVALSGTLGLTAHAETGAMTAAPEMSCAEFSALDSAGQMQAMATISAGNVTPGAMATDSATMASDAMATDVPAAGAMVDHDDLMATVEACAGHDDMMAADAMHAAAGN